MTHDTIPLYDACRAFLATQSAPLYCPGHKGGRTLPEAFKHHIADLDLNNLMETDTLHCPSGAIGEAERLLADAYGVRESFLLVGGSTAGNIVSILSACEPGATILVQRNAHKSTIAGIVLAGARPVWLTPRRDPGFGIYHGVDAAQLDEACRAHPEAAAAIVLNPTYFGTVADLAALRSVCDRHGMRLLVDEAHGPHFRFHPELPLAAEDAGADLVVQSTHKILSGLSQAAVLHSVTGRIRTERIRKMLQLVQTTSPSFPVMISIDFARWQMMREGRDIWTRVLDLARAARHHLAQLPGVRVMGKASLAGAGSGLFDLDETKIVIDVRDLGMTGTELLTELNGRGVKLELAGPTYGLAILTVGTEAADLDRLLDAMRAIVRGRAPRADVHRDAIDEDLYVQPEQVMAPRESFWGAQEAVCLERAEGRVCAEIVTPYPPGIPMLMPGERIALPILERLQSLRDAGCPISASDPSFERILVVGA